jgi:signal transduction histidine kinase
VSNAIKFTDEGYVRIHLSESDASIKITVQDSGSGIRTEDLAVLFERFRQGNHKRSTSGLGLYLSRRIIEVHQGTIAVESEFGKGSTFTVQLQGLSDRI